MFEMHGKKIYTIVGRQVLLLACRETGGYCYMVGMSRGVNGHHLDDAFDLEESFNMVDLKQ